MREWLMARLKRWLEPELFQPFVFGVLCCLGLSEFVRGSLTLSLLPTYGRTVLGFAVEWTSLALSMISLVDNVFRIPVGWIVDRIGQRIVMLVGFALAVSSVVLMMNVRSFPGLLLSAGLLGLGVTPMWPSAVSGIGRATPQKNRASFMGYLYIFWLAGMGLGPVLINLVIGRTYQFAFWLLIALDSLGFLLAFILVRPKTRGENSKLHPHPRPAMDREYWHSLWRNVRQVAFLFPGMFAQTFAVASLVPVLTLYAKVVLHISGAMYSLMLAVGGVFTVGLLLPAGKLVDRFGPRKFLVPGFLVAGLALGIYPFFHTLLMSYVTVGILGVAYAFILPSWNSVLDHSIDADKKGTLWGVFMTVEGIGSTLGPYLGGLVWDVFSPEAPFWISGGVILIMGLLYLVLPIESRGQHGVVLRRRVRAR